MENQKFRKIHVDPVNKLHVEDGSGKVANVHTSKEDAEQLVKAWNNHDDLLAALKHAKFLLCEDEGVNVMYSETSVTIAPITSAIEKATK